MLTFRQCVRLACAFFFSFSSAHSLSLTVLAMFASSVELQFNYLALVVYFMFAFSAV